MQQQSPMRGQQQMNAPMQQRGGQFRGPPTLQSRQGSRRQSEIIELRERSRRQGSGHGGSHDEHEGEHFFSMNLLDVGPVSREVQLSIDVIVMHFAFNGLCSLIITIRNSNFQRTSLERFKTKTQNDSIACFTHTTR